MVKKVREDAPIHKHTLNLYAGDYAAIQRLFPDIGAGVIIRKIVRAYVEKIEKETTPTIPQMELDLDDGHR